MVIRHSVPSLGPGCRGCGGRATWELRSFPFWALQQAMTPSIAATTHVFVLAGVQRANTPVEALAYLRYSRRYGAGWWVGSGRVLAFRGW